MSGPESQVRRALSLRNFPAFADLGPDALAVLARPCAPRSFASGDVVLSPGGPTATLHFILEGAVEVLEEGRVVRTMRGREAVGGLAVLDPESAEVDARAAAPTRTLALSREDLWAVFEDHPDIRIAVTGAVARTLCKLLERTHQAPRLSGEGAREAARSDDLVEAISAVAAAFAPFAISVAAAADLVRDGRLERLREGAVGWSRGDAADEAWVVFEGRLEVELGAGRPALGYGPGQVLGVLEALSRRPRWYAVRAAESAAVMRLPVDALLDATEAHAPLASGLLALLARTAARAYRAAAEGGASTDTISASSSSAS